VTPDAFDAGALDGLSVADAIDAIDPEHDEGSRIRQALVHVSEDGVVSHAGAEEGLSEASLLVSTVENRTEVASNRLSETRETAAKQPDLDVIDRRLSRFETRMAEIRDDAEAVSEQLESVVDRFDETTSLYELGDRLRSLTARARSVQQRADELYVDLDDFETWLEEPQQRRDELHADIDAISDTVSVLDETLERLERGVTDGSERGLEVPEEPGLTWVGATFRSRVVALLLSDVRDEHDQLQQWVEQGASDPAATTASDSTVHDRIRSLQADLDRLDDRLRTVGTPEWRERFDADLEQFETAIAPMEPPVDWDEVQATLETHRDRIDSQQ
jgi:septal ring factor EnvC (AmiA/AmiB activator)